MTTGRNVKKAIIPAAGRGTRHYPASAAVRKEFFPIVDLDGKTRPVIQLIVMEALSSGVEEICIVTSPGDDQAFQDFFKGIDENAPGFKPHMREDSELLNDLGKRITYREQAEQLGFGHAIWCARDFAGDDHVLVLLGDHIYISNTSRSCAGQIVDAYIEHGGNISSVKSVPEEKLHLCGVIKTNSSTPPWQVTEIHEKPAVDFARQNLQTPGVMPSPYLGFFGTHVMGPQIFECLSEMIRNDIRQYGEYQFTVAQSMLAQKSDYWAVPIDGETYDIGVPAGFSVAQAVMISLSPHAKEAEEAVREAAREFSAV